MRFNREQMEAARNADPVTVLAALGYTIKKRSGSEYSLVEHDSLMINPGKGWYWNSRDMGGKSTIDLVMALEGIEKPYEAAEVILGSSYYPKQERSSDQSSEKDKTSMSFSAPERNDTNKRVFAYLNQTRGISKDIIRKFIREGFLYEAKSSHNAVFVGKDKDGVPRYAFERGTNTGKRFVREVAGSKKEHGFCVEGASDVLHVFESAVDVLSFLTLKEILGAENIDSCLALSGTTLKALDQYMQDHPGKIFRIDVRTDNDAAGKRIYEKIRAHYGGSHEVRYRLPAIHKDYNEVLQEVNEVKSGLTEKALEKKLKTLISIRAPCLEEKRNSLISITIMRNSEHKTKGYER